MARVENVAAAEAEARTANVFGGWKEYARNRPHRRWVRRSDGQWSSFDPVIQRQIERKAAKDEAEKAKVA